jgi:hypothetical protein
LKAALFFANCKKFNFSSQDAPSKWKTKLQNACARQENTMNNHELSTNWPDFYDLLHVPPTASEAVLGRCIAHSDAQARVNWEHPDPQKRHEYRQLAEETLPQCRRVLLDRRNRALYDRALLAHKSGAPQDFAAFLTTLFEPESSKKTAHEGEVLVLQTTTAGANAMEAAIADGPVRIPPRHRTPVLSNNALYLMTAIVAHSLMVVIQIFVGAIS